MNMMPSNPPRDSDLAKLDQVALLSRSRPVWLRVGRLIDGVSDRPLPSADIVFDAGQIRFVAADGKAPSRQDLIEGQNAPDAILPNATLLPCLIEAHAHCFLEGTPIGTQERELYLKNPPQWMLSRAQARWPKIVQCGIGAVRDAGDRYGVGLALAAECKTHRGKMAATPWIDSPGPAIYHRGRYGSFMGEPIEDFASPADCVAARVAAGADRIKLLVSGIIDFKVGQVTVPPQMPAAEVADLVRAAASHGLQTFAHASGTQGIENSIAGGVTTVEHGFFITQDQLARMRDRQIAWVPTLAPVQLQIDRAADLRWDDQVVSHLKRIIESHQQMLRQAHAMRVKVIAGSDSGSCGVPHGTGFLEELCQMERAGMPPMAVLRACTGVSASTLNFAEPIGQISPGFRSRFIITHHDPLETVANLQKDKIILFDGAAIQCNGDLNTEGL
ncbi:MAG: amidohydrolase family protein [Tepidisphaeraceae bacterium]